MENQDLQNNKNSDVIEFANLAAKIIGVKSCNIIRMKERSKEEQIQIIITIIFPEYSTSIDEQIKLLAFNSYFLNNYGTKKNDITSCFFNTNYEAFYFLIKAWDNWNNSLSENLKNVYLNKAKYEHDLSNLKNNNFLHSAVD